jgi:hypothetical protein
MEAIWNSNPLVTKLYCFEDGNCFINQRDAQSYKKDTKQDFTIKERDVEKEEVKTKTKNK